MFWNSRKEDVEALSPTNHVELQPGRHYTVNRRGKKENVHFVSSNLMLLFVMTTILTLGCKAAKPLAVVRITRWCSCWPTQQPDRRFYVSGLGPPLLHSNRMWLCHPGPPSAHSHHVLPRGNLVFIIVIFISICSSRRCLGWCAIVWLEGRVGIL